jgi:hypothetical protein
VKLPPFISAQLAVMPDPRWKPEQAKRGAPKPSHPCVVVVALLDTSGKLWIWDEILGFRPAG